MGLSPPRVCLRQGCDHNYGGFTNDVVRFGLCLVAWGVVSQFASLGRVSFRMSVTEVPTFVLDSMSTSACYRSWTQQLMVEYQQPVEVATPSDAEASDCAAFCD